MNGMSTGVESIQNMGLGPNVTLITLNSEGTTSIASLTSGDMYSL